MLAIIMLPGHAIVLITILLLLYEHAMMLTVATFLFIKFSVSFKLVNFLLLLIKLRLTGSMACMQYTHALCLQFQDCMHG